MSLQTTHAGGSFLGIPGRERTEMASMANSYYFASWLAGGRLCDEGVAMYGSVDQWDRSKCA